ncbi:exodeoxyribonuclease VII small subunit [Thermomonas haemolytica]|uniref:Exodeoxyribonuclease 7 small subunit n=1 Tax=Thermomonas haemolytica TaxID=141949 RepID=A0A4V2V2R6_9GAMM|nr:exodeoxyribonuclease VII small subunit [Thermomonas haemolytica]TCT26102.1 exodeoxyribonuclease VII small subunit [Thermomonas haemolytica]TNY28620.1 exodeoxyribonuclease VII small subunit [Thermomonas haemolytica]
MAKTPDTQAAPQDASAVADFEQSMQALEQLVAKMEAGDMTLEESLAAYERGVGLYRRCQSALEQAELRVRQLSDPARPEQANPFENDDNPFESDDD